MCFIFIEIILSLCVFFVFCVCRHLKNFHKIFINEIALYALTLRFVKYSVRARQCELAHSVGFHCVLCSSCVMTKLWYIFIIFYVRYRTRYAWLSCLTLRVFFRLILCYFLDFFSSCTLFVCLFFVDVCLFFCFSTLLFISAQFVAVFVSFHMCRVGFVSDGLRVRAYYRIKTSFDALFTFLQSKQQQQQ